MNQDINTNETDIFIEYANDPTSKPLPAEYQRESDRIIDEARATEQATVQMVDAYKAADGYIEYRGEAEDAEDWLYSLVDYTVELVSDGVKGWGEYTHLLRLVGEYIPGYNAGIDPAHRGEPIPTLYYLVTAETARRAL